MSTAAVSSHSVYQQYFQARTSDQEALGQALDSGNLAAAQQEYSAIQTLAQNGPLTGGNAYVLSQRQQDFAAVGQALQNGDLAGAQQAFAQLRSTFQTTNKATPVNNTPADETPAVVVNIGNQPSTAGASAGGSSAASAATSNAAAGPEIVLNLGNAPAGEEITIGVSNTGNGGEQVTVSVANQQSQTQSASQTPNPEQITLNLAQNSNEQIILNLFNSTAASSTTASNGVNVTA